MTHDEAVLLVREAILAKIAALDELGTHDILVTGYASNLRAAIQVLADKKDKNTMKAAVRFRFYLTGTLIWTETLESTVELDMSDLSSRHARWMLTQAGDQPWVLEAELLDDPDDFDRFLQFRSMHDPAIE